MGNRRMLSKTVTRSDAFLDMPFSAQALYMHLSLEADDEGFLENPKSLTRLIGAGADDLATLTEAGYLIPFESGVYVIRHWHINNLIRGDRKHETAHQAERRRLIISDMVYQLTTNGQPTDTQTETEYKLSKVNLSESKISEEKTSEAKPREGKERKEGAGGKGNQLPPNYLTEFDYLFSNYPNKGDTEKALAAFTAERDRGTTVEEIETGLAAFAEKVGTDPRLYPNLKQWIECGYWQ